MYRNNEGYSDPTAGMAMSLIMNEYKQEQKRHYVGKNRQNVYVSSKVCGKHRSKRQGGGCMKGRATRAVENFEKSVHAWLSSATCG